MTAQEAIEAMGMRCVSVAELNTMVNALGYRLDRSMDCRSMARFRTGPRAGESYLCCTTGINEIASRP